MNFLDITYSKYDGFEITLIGIGVAILVVLILVLFFVVRYNKNKKR